MTLPSIGASKVIGWLRDPAHRKWVVATVTVALLLATIMTARYWRSEAVEARVDAEIAEQGVEVLDRARRADDAAQVNLEHSRAAIQTEEDEHRVATEEALRDHAEWADQPVPADVLGSLRD